MAIPVGVAAGAWALSSIFSANSARKEGEYEAAMMRENAVLARQQAEDAVARGQADTMQVRQRALQLVGSQRARMAAQGIDISSGSALDVQVDTGKLAEIDALTVRNNAAREAWGFKTQAADYERRAGLARIAGRNRATTTLLTGGLNAMSLGVKMG